MELIDRYLNAVEFWLPSAQRADVVEELSDDLRSQVDEREAATGRDAQTVGAPARGRR
jgi:hypothetical protein